MGGNRSGKTELGILEDISWCLGYRPYLKPSDPDYFTPIAPPVHGLITTESLGMTGSLKTVIEPKMMEWVPKSQLAAEPRKNQQGVRVFWEFRSGSTLQVQAYEQDIEKFEGSRFHFWHGDEPMKQDIYAALSRSLVDFAGYAWFTMTPTEQPWIYNGLFLNPNVHSVTIGMVDNIRAERKWYGEKVMAGGLTEEKIQDFINKLTRAGVSPAEIAARSSGEFKFFGGRVIENFTPQIHCCDPFELPREHTIYVSIDPHPAKDWCVTFLAVLPTNRFYIYKVLWLNPKQLRVEDICEAIMIELRGRKPFKVIIDPLASSWDPQTGKNLLQDLREKSKYRLNIQHSERSERAKILGIQKIRAALFFDEEKGIQPQLYIFKTEDRAIKQLLGWMSSEEDDKIIKKDDDFPETLYRLMLLDPKYWHPKVRERIKKEYIPHPITGY